MVLQISPPDGQRPNLSVRDAVIRQLFCGDKTVGNFRSPPPAGIETRSDAREIIASRGFKPFVEESQNVGGSVGRRVVGDDCLVDFEVEVVRSKQGVAALRERWLDDDAAPHVYPRVGRAGNKGRGHLHFVHENVGVIVFVPHDCNLHITFFLFDVITPSAGACGAFSISIPTSSFIFFPTYF